MRISKISADRNDIIFELCPDDGTGNPRSAVLTVEESAPTFGDEPRVISTFRIEAENGRFTLPRFSDNGVHDRMFSRYAVYVDGARIKGDRYVSEIAPDVAETVAPFPKFRSIKAMNTSPEIQALMKVEQGRPDISLPGIMTMIPDENTIPFDREGKTYYFRRDAIEHFDEYMRAYEYCTLILLNSSRSFGSKHEKALLDVCLHPAYDAEEPNALISAFNRRTEEGLECYAAFLDFLFSRYTRADGKYGRVIGAVIGNEIDQQGIWGNAGDMTCEDYIAEYSEAMRLAWQIGRTHYSSFRVYISLTNNWSVATPGSSLRFYTAKKCVTELAVRSRTEGDFDWGVAYHPYPENLFYPDFWNDRAANFTFNTPHITFKNMEVLEAFLAQELFLYKGEPRRIIFSEQGFNTVTGPLEGHFQRNGEAGVVLAYMKARNMKTVDMFTHHSSIDNPGEFGLNLGLIKYDPDAPGHIGKPKPAYYAFMAMDTDAEEEYVKKAKARIDPDLFEYLLHPVIFTPERTPEDDLNESILTNTNG